MDQTHLLTFFSAHWSAFSDLTASFCLPTNSLPSHFLACLFTGPLTFLPNYPLSPPLHIHIYLPTLFSFLFTHPLTFLHTFMAIYLLNFFPYNLLTHLFDLLPNYMLTYLLAYIFTFLSPTHSHTSGIIFIALLTIIVITFQFKFSFYSVLFILLFLFISVRHRHSFMVSIRIYIKLFGLIACHSFCVIIVDDFGIVNQFILCHACLF